MSVWAAANEHLQYTYIPLVQYTTLSIEGQLVPNMVLCAHGHIRTHSTEKRQMHPCTQPVEIKVNPASHACWWAKWSYTGTHVSVCKVVKPVTCM